MVEQNWSGRGQHVEFDKADRRAVDDILQVEEVLGSTNSAIVQSVKCKRIRLARKTIRCNRHLTKEMAIDEVAHMSRLDHAHVVRVIGTYTMGSDLSILMYPVADYNLRSFLQQIYISETGFDYWRSIVKSLPNFFGCLSSAVQHIHSRMTKHMDIKPQNILVRRNTAVEQQHRESAFKVYIADFGISRTYESLDATETEGPTMFTRKYAAPEVVDQQRRGLPADVFSLGCVFLEILVALANLMKPVPSLRYADYFWLLNPEAHNLAQMHEALQDQLQKTLKSNEYGDSSYQANLIAVQNFLSAIGKDKPGYRFLILQIACMISSDALERPTAEVLAGFWKTRAPCCVEGADPLEAAPLNTN
ncbi:kinase-like domain-containing protein [Massariosphaeria phaeospora]|uniref:Kinase-like domain-containing protein n=1 Tax=Massariosphaeria phaeospora TaxID=100035 RepID=A0A7C8MXF1_9PLEO|nr:kinase-like domain-containing protein [Massariosphaeria phaeospora]